MALGPPESATLKDFADSLNTDAKEYSPIAIDAGATAIGEGALAFVAKYKEALEEFVSSNIAAIIANSFTAFLHAASNVPEFVGFMVGVIENARQRGQINANREFPTTLLDLGTLAHLGVTQQIDVGSARAEALKHGMEAGRFDQLVKSQFAHLSIPDALELWRRGKLDANAFRNAAILNGLFPAEIEHFRDLLPRLMDVTPILQLWLRGEITTSEADARMNAQGILGDDPRHYRTLANYIPPVADLVRMAVREAFNAQQIKELSLDQEFPAEFAEWSQKQGVAKEWAQRYWYAHWELPSPTQAFEMFHRDVITRQQLEALLKAQDYAPTWREPMLKISYNNLTRVDVRRMYEMGIINADQVERAYKDSGYSPENAKRLRRFVEADVYESSISPIKARIFTLYRKGIVTETELRAFLTDLQMPPDQQQRFIAAENMLAAEEHTDRMLNIYKKQFMANVVTATELAIKIGPLGLSAQAVANTIQAWVEEKRSRVTRLSTRDLHDAHGEALMSSDDVRKELRERGMRDKDIEVFLKLKAPQGEEIV